MTVFEQLQGVFREVFDDPELGLSPEMTAKDVYGWDSLSNMTLLMAIALEFKLKIVPEDQRHFRNIGDMAQFIEQQRGI